MLQLPEVLPPAEVTSPVCAAVERCLAAYKQAYRAAGTLGADQDTRHDAACHAYRLALPRTETPTDIQAFINCVTYGMALGAIDREESTHLLYAAQVSLSAARRMFAKQ
ncbi:hypothetical protein DYQ86_00775 [Acidobacteria bacterium AB60]|nr:hypothetical protein DYQ86_00775 [Acidobacteria bacterium AB60]